MITYFLSNVITPPISNAAQTAVSSVSAKTTWNKGKTAIKYSYLPKQPVTKAQQQSNIHICQNNLERRHNNNQIFIFAKTTCNKGTTAIKYSYLPKQPVTKEQQQSNIHICQNNLLRRNNSNQIFILILPKQPVTKEQQQSNIHICQNNL